MTATAKVPTVTKCCCYFELRTGGLIMGWFDVVTYSLVLLGAIGSLFTKTLDKEKEEVAEITVLGEVDES